MKVIKYPPIDVAACTGDLLVVDRGKGQHTYLMFCESQRSVKKNENEKFYYQLVKIENGYVFDYELADDEEIKVGTHLGDYGEVIEIIDSENLTLQIKP